MTDVGHSPDFKTLICSTLNTLCDVSSTCSPTLPRVRRPVQPAAPAKPRGYVRCVPGQHRVQTHRGRRVRGPFRSRGAHRGRGQPVVRAGWGHANNACHVTIVSFQPTFIERRGNPMVSIKPGPLPLERVRRRDPPHFLLSRVKWHPMTRRAFCRPLPGTPA